jgi:hypothetical protein
VVVLSPNFFYENGFARAFGGDGGTVVRDNAGVSSLRCRQGNNYGDKTVGARENDLLRICLFLKKENFH